VARYITKIILALEPGNSVPEIHQTIREITFNNAINLLPILGVDPVIYRNSHTNGIVDLQLWVTTLINEDINNHVLPLYFVGAKKYLFFCHSAKAVKFIDTIMTLTSEHFNALNELVIIFQQQGNAIDFEEVKESLIDFFDEKLISNYSFHYYSSRIDLENLFNQIINEVSQQSSIHASFAPIGFNVEVIERIAKKMGFETSNEHQISLVSRDIHFIVDIAKNTVIAEMKHCRTCPLDCKVKKKLCIEVAKTGYTTVNGLGDLRLISVLLAIKDESIFTLKGDTREEDLTVQLTKLRKDYLKKCKNK
jgi:hypothetical protein